MVDLAGIPPFGGGGFSIRQPVEPPAPMVPPVEPSANSAGLSGNISSGQPQTESGRQASVPAPLQRDPKEPVDRHAVPGPPPTFQISLLEMDRDLSATLARMNAAYAIERDAEAIAGRSDETGQARPADAREVAQDTGAARPDATDEAALNRPPPVDSGAIADPTAVSAPAVSGETD